MAPKCPRSRDLYLAYVVVTIREGKEREGKERAERQVLQRCWCCCNGQSSPTLRVIPCGVRRPLAMRCSPVQCGAVRCHVSVCNYEFLLPNFRGSWLALQQSARPYTWQQMCEKTPALRSKFCAVLSTLQEERPAKRPVPSPSLSCYTRLDRLLVALRKHPLL